MGMYSLNESFDGSVQLTDTIESIMEDSNLQPADGDNFEEMAMDIVIDTHRNYNTIMESIGIMELSYLEQTGKEMVYTEGTLSDMFQAVKKFILKIWDKIKAFFKRFIMLFDTYFKDDKAFVDKYRKQIFTGKSLTDFEFKGYKFIDIYSSADKMIKKCSNMATESHNQVKGNTTDKDAGKLDKANEGYDDKLEADRGTILKEGLEVSGEKFTDSEFKKELHDGFRGGEDKEDLDGEWKSADAAVSRLVGSKDNRKKLKDLFNSTKKAIDSSIKDVESKQREYTRSTGTDEKANKQANNNMKNANYYLRHMRDMNALVASINGAALQGMKDYSRQDKQLLVAIIRYSPKKEGALGESGSMNWEHEDETARSFLGNIQLV